MFDDAFAKTLGHEGGYVNNASDPGGETNFGISKRAYPMVDIAGLTVEQAKVIYRRDYWGPAGCDAVPDTLKFHLFDFAVNAGVKTAIKALQRSTGETQDGILGPLTLQAVQSTDPAKLVMRFSGARLDAMTDAQTWSVFGRGWAKRIAKNLMEA
jgi:lysozyme family protein